MNVVWILIWMQFVPDKGIRYYHLGTYDNKILCGTGFSAALVMVNDPSETLQCIEINLP